MLRGWLTAFIILDMTVGPGEQGELSVHKEVGATQADNALEQGSAGGSGSPDTSPFRLVFVIVPLIVIVVGTANLMGLWATSSQHAAREERLRQAERRPLDREVDEAPVSIGRAAERAPARTEAGFDATVVVARLAAANTEDGVSAFRFCSPCHTGEKNGPHRIGPNLWGIVGSRKAALPGYNYSIALKAKGGTWSYEDLAEYIHNPRTFAPGTSMAFVGIADNGRIANLIAYLRTLSDNPAPLPSQGKR